MHSTSHVAINGPNVIHETIDGEAVIINLMTGRYYSLEGTGSEIWSLIEKEASVPTIVEGMTRRHGIAHPDAQHVVVHFLEQLLEEKLIRVDAEDEAVACSAREEAIASSSGLQTSGFAIPELRVYTDLEDLLLLDPIHEVGDDGWPVAKAAGSPKD